MCLLEFLEGLPAARFEEFAEMRRIVKAQLKSYLLAAFIGKDRCSLGLKQYAVLNESPASP